MPVREQSLLILSGASTLSRHGSSCCVPPSVYQSVTAYRSSLRPAIDVELVEALLAEHLATQSLTLPTNLLLGTWVFRRPTALTSMPREAASTSAGRANNACVTTCVPGSSEPYEMV